MNLKDGEAEDIIRIVYDDKGMQMNGNGGENLQVQRSLFSPYILFHMSCHIPILQQKQKKEGVNTCHDIIFFRSKRDVFSSTRATPTLLNTFKWHIKNRKYREKVKGALIFTDFQQWTYNTFQADQLVRKKKSAF